MLITLTNSGFWAKIDNNKVERNLDTDQRIKQLGITSLKAIIQIIESYAGITKIHAKSLKTVIYRISDGKLKQLLLEIYHEEIGEGNPKKAHAYLISLFLSELNTQLGGNFLLGKINPKVSELINDFEKGLNNGSPYFAIGAAGMGSECICQVILDKIWNEISNRPDLKEVLPNVNCEFWNIHTGGVDIAHGVRMRQAIDLEIGENPDHSLEILRGFEFSINFWDCILDSFFEITCYLR